MLFSPSKHILLLTILFLGTCFVDAEEDLGCVLIKISEITCPGMNEHNTDIIVTSLTLP